MTREIVALLLGFMAGALAGMLGVGGAVLFIPAFVILGLTQLQAQASAIAAMLPTVAVGAARNTREGFVQWRSALIIGATSIGGVVLGAPLAHVAPESLLRKLFGVFLLVMAFQSAWRLIGARRTLRAIASQESEGPCAIDAQHGTAFIGGEQRQIER